MLSQFVSDFLTGMEEMIAEVGDRSTALDKAFLHISFGEALWNLTFNELLRHATYFYLMQVNSAPSNY